MEDTFNMSHLLAKNVFLGDRLYGVTFLLEEFLPITATKQNWNVRALLLHVISKLRREQKSMSRWGVRAAAWREKLNKMTLQVSVEVASSHCVCRSHKSSGSFPHENLKLRLTTEDDREAHLQIGKVWGRRDLGCPQHLKAVTD